MNIYDGPERRTYPAQRKMMLTESDISAIANIVAVQHKCRYDIEPEDMNEIIAFVQRVKKNVDDYNEGIRKTVIKICVIGTFVAAIYFLETKFPFLRPLMKYLKGQ